MLLGWQSWPLLRGVPSAVCVSEPLLAAAEVDPLFVAETASWADVGGGGGGSCRAPDILNPLSDGDSWGQEDTVTVPELEVFLMSLGRQIQLVSCARI